MTPAVTLATMGRDHWPRVREIYLDAISTGDATLETDCPDWDHWGRMHLDHSRVVAMDGDRVVGWAALSPVSERCVYDGVAEVSVYVAADARGEGVGRFLLEALVTRSEQNGIWTLQAGMFPENAASLALHASCGFRRVGLRERIGRLRSVWRDVILMERRSPVVGS